MFGDFGANAVNVVADIHAICDGALVGIFADEIFIEEADGLLARRGGETDEKGVEVFEHLAPQIVDGAMAFVGDDEVECFDRDHRIVFNLALRLSAAAIPNSTRVFVESSVELFAAQHRIKPLDCGDRYAATESSRFDVRCWTL